jgi:uncharacterized repeat protein (TIGR01451 family)
VEWTDNSNNEDGFRIYRHSPANGSTNLADYGAPIATNPTPPGQTNYIDNPAIGPSYEYAVTAFNAFGASAAAFDGIVSNGACVPQVTATLSLYKVQNVLCNPINTGCPTVHSGNTVTVRLTISNTGGAAANNVRVVHTDVRPNFDYTNLSVSCSGCPNPPLPETLGANPNPVTWNTASPAYLGNKLNDGTNWLLDFDAVVTSQSNQPVDFFQDSVQVIYQGGSVTRIGGPWLMSTGAAKPPGFQEVVP